MARDLPEEARIGAHALDIDLLERLAQRRESAGAFRRPGDDLGEHRVVVDGDLITGVVATVHPDPRSGRRQAKAREPAGRRQEASLRVLRVEPRLDRVTPAPDLFLSKRQRFTRRHAELPLDQVQPRDHLGHRVLDLQARVHLEKVEAATVVQELDRARPLVFDRACGGDRCSAHGGARPFVDPRRRRFLDHLLVAALQRAIALEDVHGVTVPVGEYLDLDVPTGLDEALEQHALVAEGLRGLAPRAGERLGELPGRPHDAHPLAAAAGGGLDQEREAEAPRFLLQVRGSLLGAVIARQHRHARRRHQ